MNRTDVNNYLKMRNVQRALEYGVHSLGSKETDVLFELRLTEDWTSFSYLRERTGQGNSDLSNRSLGPLEAKGYVTRRIKKNHKGEARITPKGKRLVERL